MTKTVELGRGTMTQRQQCAHEERATCSQADMVLTHTVHNAIAAVSKSCIRAAWHKLCTGFSDKLLNSFWPFCHIGLGSGPAARGLET